MENKQTSLYQDGLRSRLLVSSSQEIATGIVELTLRGGNLAQYASPGQFVMVSVSGNHDTRDGTREGIDPFLRRPFSIADIDREADEIKLIYQIQGHGTARMAQWTTGQEVDVLGPLGNGFSWDDALEQAILVGGGLGTAALLPLAKQLRSEGKAVQVFLGARSADLLFGFPLFEQWGCRIQIATEDGSSGTPGLVTLPLESYLMEQKSADEQDKDTDRQSKSPLLFACGPEPFLHAISTLCSTYQIQGQISMEERMGCGFGACMGCSIETQLSEDHHQRKRVCKDGPVFTIGEVLFHG